jgi:hypothetical protein
MNDLHTNSIGTVYINGAKKKKGKGRKSDAHTSESRALIGNMRELKQQVDDLEIHGHPDSVFHIGCRIMSQSQRFYRSLDVHEVKGGGVILQSSWYENGRPAISMRYYENLALEWQDIQQDDGTVKRAPLVIRRGYGRFAFWQWLRNVCRAVLGC